MNDLELYVEAGPTSGFRTISVTDAKHPYLAALVAARPHHRLRALVHAHRLRLPEGGRRRQVPAARLRGRTPQSAGAGGDRKVREHRAVGEGGVIRRQATTTKQTMKNHKLAVPPATSHQNVGRKESRMRYLTTAILGTFALLMVQCSDGSGGYHPTPGTAGTTGAGGTGVAGTTGSAGTGGSGSGTAGTGDVAGTAGTTGTAGSSSEGTAGARGRLVRATPERLAPLARQAPAGARARQAPPAPKAREAGRQRDGGDGRCDGHRRNDGHRRGSGPQDRSLQDHRDGLDAQFAHDSIPTCLTMLQDLGKATAPERAKITGLAADTTWTVDQIVHRHHQIHTISPKSPPTISRTTNCSIPTIRPARFSPMRRAGLKRSRSSWTTGPTVARGRDSIPRPTSKTTTDGPGFKTT